MAAARKKTSTYSINEELFIQCNLTYAVSKIEGRWKILIIDKLGTRPMRFSELKKEIPQVSERMLTLQLQSLEQDGLVKRTVFAEVPPRVVYELTASAMEFVPIFRQLSIWGEKNRNMVDPPTR